MQIRTGSASCCISILLIASLFLLFLWVFSITICLICGNSISAVCVSLFIGFVC